MVKQLISDFKIHKKSHLLSFLVLPGSFLAGLVLLVILMGVPDGPDSWVCFGTMIAMIMTAICTIMLYMYYHQELMLALSMGRTRREFILSYTVRKFLWLVAAYVLLLAFGRLEMALYTAWYPQYECLVSFDFLLKWQVVLPVLVLLTLLNVCIGALYSRIGKKFGIVVSFIWAALCMLATRLIPDDGHEAEGTAQFPSAVPLWLLVGIGVAAAAVMVVVIVRLGRKQMVR